MSPCDTLPLMTRWERTTAATEAVALAPFCGNETVSGLFLDPWLLSFPVGLPSSGLTGGSQTLLTEDALCALGFCTGRPREGPGARWHPGPEVRTS